MRVCLSIVSLPGSQNHTSGAFHILKSSQNEPYHSLVSMLTSRVLTRVGRAKDNIWSKDNGLCHTVDAKDPPA